MVDAHEILCWPGTSWSAAHTQRCWLAQGAMRRCGRCSMESGGDCASIASLPHGNQVAASARKWKICLAWLKRAVLVGRPNCGSVTQPAFSRRIQSLEAWAGTDLVDRSSLSHTPDGAGRRFMPSRWRCCNRCRPPRAMLLRAPGSAGRDRVCRAAHPGLHLFPAWVSNLRETPAPSKPPDCAERA